MMIKIVPFPLLFFSICCIFLNIANAENDSSQTQNITNIQDEITKSIKLSKTFVRSLKEINIKHILHKMPVNSSNLYDKIDNLTNSDSGDDNISKQISETQKLFKELENTRYKIIIEKNKRNKYIDVFTKNKKIIDSAQQLLSSPEELDPSDKEKLVQSIKEIKKLLKQFQISTNKINEKLQDVNNAMATLSRWNSALLFTNLTKLYPDAGEKTRLQKLQKKYEKKAISLTNQLNKKRGVTQLAEIEKLQKNIYQKNTIAWLIEKDITLLDIVNDSIILTEDNEKFSLKLLSKKIELVNKDLRKINQLKIAIEDNFEIFKKYTKIMGKDNALMEAFTSRLNAIYFQKLQLDNKLRDLSEVIARKQKVSLFSYNNLFAKNLFYFNITNINKSLMQIVYRVTDSFIELFEKILQKYINIIPIALISILLIYLLNNMPGWLSRPVFKNINKRNNIFPACKKIFVILKNHRYLLSFMIFAVLLIYFSGKFYSSKKIIYTLFYSIGALLLWLKITNSQCDIRSYLFKLNKIYSIILVCSILLYKLSEESLVSYELIIVYEKIMIAILIGFVWIARIFFINCLKKYKKIINELHYNYFYLGISKILPWIITCSFILNLIGYERLSWLNLFSLNTIIIYFALLLIGIFTINQLCSMAKSYLSYKLSHSKFINEDIILPINIIMKIIWLWTISNMLFNLIGWNKDSYFISKILAIINYPLLTFGKTPVTLMSIILLLLAVYMIFRIGKWLRNFCYHFLYLKIKDLGVRHSLSIFSQYVIILIGVIITLNLLGIDLTSLVVFAGALGVGIGLGLQDIAKNFISGILLLIERPLRSGDWVSIDGSEGTVKSIGIRAITVETFNNQEVIIPNGNAINNSFTNYTYSNRLIRTVLYVGTGYSCDPDLVMSILTKILDNTKEVLKEPEAKVIMWEYADSSINYRIQYYINMEKDGLWQTKTSILRAIWYEFKANDIEIPFPQRDINFRNIIQHEMLPTANTSEQKKKNKIDKKVEPTKNKKGKGNISKSDKKEKMEDVSTAEADYSIDDIDDI